MINVKTFGFDQDPVNAGDFDADSGGGIADFLAVGGGNIGYGVRQGERSNFDGGIAEAFGVREGIVEGPAFEDLVADGEFHDDRCNGKGAQGKEAKGRKK